MSKREASQRDFNFPKIKTNIDKLLGNTSKKYSSRYFQLKTQNGKIDTFLVKIRMTEILKC